MYFEKLYTLLGLFLFTVLLIMPVLSDIRFFRWLENGVIGFTKRRTAAVWYMFFGVIGVRVLLLPFLSVPVPGIHDEFSYLLMSDTFAHGRLTNPTHPLWISFETFNVNWIPTYCSMYPPAQGLFLAIGQLLGHPWIGVLISNGAMCAAVVWMLQAWIPARWAFLAGVLTALQFSVSSYWINGYWGGAVAATGGALVLGALGRIRRAARWQHAPLLGLGIAILANSRPYEGLVFCIPTVIYLVLWIVGKIKSRDNLEVRVTQVFLPLLASMILLGSFMLYYNWRLTGNPLLMPHRLNTNTYESSQSFLWQKLRPALHYRNPQFEGFFNGWSRGYYHRSWLEAARLTKEKVVMLATYFFGRSEWLLLPFLPFLFRDKRTRFLLTSVIVGGVGVFLVVWGHPHYAAPLVCVVFALVVQTMRHLNTVKLKGRRLGALVVRVILIVLMAVTLDRVMGHRPDLDDRRTPTLVWRVVIADQLRGASGKHLVIVRYRPRHDYHLEFVYNGAEIDSANVVWARELDEAQNHRLLAYFKDRHVWLFRPDEYDVRLQQLIPYPRTAVPKRALK
jgi:hypothetical protein